MAQIEDYERPFVVVYGEDGQPNADIISGADGPHFPIYKARRMIVALLTTEIEKPSTTEAEREALQIIRREFNNAETGALVFGKVMRWLNRHGKRRFIGMVEEDQHYTKAGMKPAERKPGYQPPRVRDFPVGSSFDHGARPGRGAFGVDPGEDRRIVTPQRETDAERIAKAMAKSAREAVDGQDDKS